MPAQSQTNLAWPRQPRPDLSWRSRQRPNIVHNEQGSRGAAARGPQPPGLIGLIGASQGCWRRWPARPRKPAAFRYFWASLSRLVAQAALTGAVNKPASPCRCSRRGPRPATSHRPRVAAVNVPEAVQVLAATPVGLAPAGPQKDRDTRSEAASCVRSEAASWREKRGGQLA